MRAPVVDDSRFVRSLLRGLLEQKRIAGEGAAAGQAGLDLPQEGPEFDLALVNWNMPAMNGLEMLRQIRAQGFDSIKVTMVTTEAGNGLILRALTADADEFLMTPGEALSEKLTMPGPVEA